MEGNEPQIQVLLEEAKHRSIKERVGGALTGALTAIFPMAARYLSENDRKLGVIAAASDIGIHIASFIASGNHEFKDEYRRVVTHVLDSAGAAGSRLKKGSFSSRRSERPERKTL